MQKNILYNILNNIYNNTSNIIKEQHIKNILKICKSNKHNLELNLPNKIIAIKEYNYLLFRTTYIYDDYKLELQNTNNINEHLIKKINNTNDNGNNICRLNSKDLNLPLYIRNTKQGDKIKVLGLNGHKLVRDILMENKIPKQKRINYPILVDKKDNILWIPNLKKSQFNIEKNGIYDIILEYIEKEEK